MFEHVIVIICLGIHCVIEIITSKRIVFANYMTEEPKQSLRLTDCLDFFTYAETLSKHNPWYCSTCKEHQQASKKLDFWKLPTVLVCHLKRYKTAFRINKNEVYVDCPIE